MKKLKTIQQYRVREGSPMERVGLWWEGFQENVPFEFRMVKSRSDGWT